MCRSQARYQHIRISILSAKFGEFGPSLKWHSCR